MKTTAFVNVRNGLTAALLALICAMALAQVAWADEENANDAANMGAQDVQAVQDVVEEETAAADEPVVATEGAADLFAAEPAANMSAAADTVTQQLIADGTYLIQAGVGSPFVLDVSGGSKSSGANVQIYESNGTDAQKWNVAYNKSDDTYTIKSVVSKLALDVLGASKANGANVQQYTSNSTDAQKWKITALGNGQYTITSALKSDFVLDVAGGRAANGANVQGYTSNNTNAQKWLFFSLAGITGEQVAEDGLYYIESAVGNSMTLDVAGGSYDNCANAQTWTANQTNAQRWALSWDSGTKTYGIRSVGTTKALDVSGANPGSGVNVHLYDANGTAAQRWVLQKSGSYYKIVSALSGMALDVTGASNKAGANVGTYIPNGTNAQNWKLTKVTDGTIQEGVYTIYSMVSPTSQVIDVTSGETKAGTQLQTYQSNKTYAQKYRVAHVSGNTYTMQPLNSGLYMTSSSGKVTQQAKSSGTDQQWVITFESAGLRIASAADTAKSIAVTNSAKNGSPLSVAASGAAGAKDQHFRVAGVSIIDEGYFIIKNAKSGKVLDVAGGSLGNGANVQQYDANNSGAQVFYIAPSGSNYRIENARSRKVLDVAGGATGNGANVQQYAWNGTGAQLWSASLDADCNIVFTNVKSGKVLEVAGGSTNNGANVQIYASNSTDAQKWKLTPTDGYSLTGNAELDAYIANIVSANGNDLRRCFDWMSSLGHVQSLDSSTRWGIMGDDVINHYALLVKQRGAADCYGDASLFCLLARACGYEANFRAGSCPSASGGMVPHGWTEVYVNGATYVCDANLRRDLPGYNWYMITYSSAPVSYGR